MSESTAPGLTSRLAKLNPFSNKRTHEVDEEDVGEAIDVDAVAGGSHGAAQTDADKRQLRISHALRAFLVREKVVPEADAGLDSDQTTEVLRTLLDKPHIHVPARVTDRSHPLPAYFISSSHNTYLLAHQLYGTSSATAYETALRTGSRCVEIDAWDGDDDPDEPKVTHGFTLVSNVPFRAVCETIRDVVDHEAAEAAARRYRPAPVFISLENHCDARGQARLAHIMTEVWGDRLLSRAVRAEGHAEQRGDGEHVTLEELGGKIVVIVEYHLPDEAADSDSSSSSSSSSSEDEDEKEARKRYKAKKKSAPAAGIVPELAALGVYAQSVKPANNSWFDAGELAGGPHHHLINVSETGLAAHLPAHRAAVARHNARHLMRVFPKGTRVASANLHPVPFWGVGAQICALNWQTFGAAMQLNAALFAGSDGFVLKPEVLRGGGAVAKPGRKRLRLRVAGATDVPLPEGRTADEVRPYLTCSLVHPADAAGKAAKRKTAAYRQHALGFLHRGDNPPPTEPVWDETLEWEYDEDELVFLRLLVKSDDNFARNPIFAVAAVRVLYLVPGWRFVRMLDLKGKETACSVLVNFDVHDVQ